MIDALVTKAKGFLLAPAETFQQSKADEPSAVFTYYGILFLFNAILSAIGAMVVVRMVPGHDPIQSGLPVPVSVFLATFVCLFIFTLILAASIHLWVYIFGGRKGIMQTVKAVLYGNTPFLLFGWIPFLSLIFIFWSLVLGILGIRELQEMSTGKGRCSSLWSSYRSPSSSSLRRTCLPPT
jgi:hypothetical protein